MTHELGHALDDRLLYDLRDNAEDIVNEAYKEAKAGAKRQKQTLTKEEFVTLTRPSRYSLQPTASAISGIKVYEDTDKIEPPEFVAEAVADVVGNGYESAAFLSQLMWDYIIKAADEPKVYLPGEGPIVDTAFLKSKGKIV